MDIAELLLEAAELMDEHSQESVEDFASLHAYSTLSLGSRTITESDISLNKEARLLTVFEEAIDLETASANMMVGGTLGFFHADATLTAIHAADD